MSSGHDLGAAVQLNTISNLVLQTSAFCNLNCRYCYLSYDGRSRKQFLSFDRIQTLASFLSGRSLIGRKIDVSFHLGEPLTAGIEYYRELVPKLKSWLGTSTDIHFDLQTNGTLIDADWCNLFKLHKVHVGVSLDGPAAKNDAHRVDRLGRPTFDAVERGICMLRDHNIPFHVISVLTKEVTSAPVEYMSFLRRLNVNAVAFNIPTSDGSFANSPDYSLGDDFGRALKNFLAVIMGESDDWRSPLIREFDTLRLRLDGSKRVEDAVRLPMSVLSLSTDGQLHTFSPEFSAFPEPLRSKYSVGVVNEGVVRLDCARIEALSAEVNAGILKCANACRYFSLCGGGEPSTKVSENGTADSDHTTFCRLNRIAFVDAFSRRLWQ